MPETTRSRYAVYRDKLRGGPPSPVELRPCGTVAAARRHERAGEPVCDACAAAVKEHNARQYQARKRAGKE